MADRRNEDFALCRMRVSPRPSSPTDVAKQHLFGRYEQRSHNDGLYNAGLITWDESLPRNLSVSPYEPKRLAPARASVDVRGYLRLETMFPMVSIWL